MKETKTPDPDREENFPLEIILPIKTPSRNILDRTNHWVRKKNKQNIAWLFKIAGAMEDKYQARWKEIRSIKIISYRKDLIDGNNLVGGFKDLLDVLEDLKLVFNDNSTYLKHELHEQEKVKTIEAEKTHIFLDIVKRGENG